MSSLPPALQRIASSLSLFGWIGFWIQIVLGVVATLILLFAALSPNFATEGTQGTGFGLFFAICGLVTLGIAVYFAFRYTRIARSLMTARGSERPSKAETLQVIRLGLIISISGMLLTILGAQAIVGSTLALALSQPQQSLVLESQRVVKPLDLFVVQANINAITAHFAGIVCSLWLFNRVSR